MGNDNIINTYKEGFKDFEDYINEINNPGLLANTEIHEGYLVNYKHYQEFKLLIFNLQNQNPSNPSDDEKLKGYIESKKLSTESLEDVKDKVLNGYSFQIINKKIYKLICKQNMKLQHKIEYKIIPGSRGNIHLNPDKQNQIQYKNNKNNVIEPSTILGQKFNQNSVNNNLISPSNQKIDKWKIIYRDCANYFNNENLLIKKLSKNEIQTFQGYLLDKEWVDIWKKYSFYDSIKKNLFLKGINDETSIKNLISEENYKSNLNYDKIYKNFENNVITNENQILQISSSNKSYVLVDTNFLKKFASNPNIKPNNFNLFNHTIQARLLNGRTINFPTNDNIINSQHNEITQIPKVFNNNENNNRYDSEFLKHLIKFFFFKQELTKPINLQINKLYKSFLVNNKVIEKLKDIYNLNGIISILYNCNLLTGINFQNCEQSFPQISSFLNQNYPNYIMK